MILLLTRLKKLRNAVSWGNGNKYIVPINDPGWRNSNKMKVAEKAINTPKQNGRKHAGQHIYTCVWWKTVQNCGCN